MSLIVYQKLSVNTKYEPNLYQKLSVNYVLTKWLRYNVDFISKYLQINIYQRSRKWKEKVKKLKILLSLNHHYDNYHIVDLIIMKLCVNNCCHFMSCHSF